MSETKLERWISHMKGPTGVVRNVEVAEGTGRWAAWINQGWTPCQANGDPLSEVVTMPRPSTGHPDRPCEYRCNICGGIVHYDGTAPKQLHKENP